MLEQGARVRVHQARATEHEAGRAGVNAEGWSDCRGKRGGVEVSLAGQRVSPAPPAAGQTKSAAGWTRLQNGGKYASIQSSSWCGRTWAPQVTGAARETPAKEKARARPARTHARRARVPEHAIEC